LALMVLAEIDAYRGEERVRTTIPKLLEVAADFGYGGATHRLRRAFASFQLSIGEAGASRAGLQPLLADGKQKDQGVAQLTGSGGSAETKLSAAGAACPAAGGLPVLREAGAAAPDAALGAFWARGGGLMSGAGGDGEQAIPFSGAAAAEPPPPQEANPFELA